jgi:hypothetical protein
LKEILDRVVVDMNTRKYEAQAAALERWADEVDPDNLVEIDTADLRRLAQFEPPRVL